MKRYKRIQREEREEREERMKKLVQCKSIGEKAREIETRNNI